MHFRETERTANSHRNASMLLTAAVLTLVAAIPAVAQELGHAFRYDAEHVEIINAGGFDRVEYDGARADYDPRLYGYPELPVFIHRFLLPPETRIEELRFTDFETETLEGEFLPRPIEPEFPPGEEPEPHGPLPEIYESENPYPEQPITITTEGEFRGYHLVTVKVYPVQFVGATGTLRVITNMQVGASLRPMTAQELENLHRRERIDTRPPEQREDLRWLERAILNPEDLFSYSPQPENPQGPFTMSVEEDNPFGGFVPTEFPSLEGPPVRYVIITDSLDTAGHDLGDGLIDEFQRLADWKTEKGVPAVVKSVTWIEANYEGIDTPEKMREFIKDASAKWGTDYILLGGSEEIVPTRILGAPDSYRTYYLGRPDPPADMYFAELDTDWNDDGDAYFGEYDYPLDEVGRYTFQDISIGRLTVRDSLEAFVVVDKILEYECDPDEDSRPDAGFWNDVTFATGFVHDGGMNNGNGMYFTEQELITRADSCSTSLDYTRLYPDMPVTSGVCWGRDKPCYGDMRDLLSGITPAPVTYTPSALHNELEDGIHFLFHYEHSFFHILGGPTMERDSTCTEPGSTWMEDCFADLKNANPNRGHYLSDVVDHLENGANTPVVFSIGCDTNWWDKDSISEHFIRAPGGGAVAYCGAVYSSLGGWSRPYTELVFDELFVNEVANLGDVLRNATNEMDRPAVTGILYPLLGDPELPLSWEEPAAFAIAKSPTAFDYIGPRSVTITVTDSVSSSAVTGARVCLKQGDNAYAIAWTDASGEAVFEAFAPTDSTATQVMVTARNYYPKRDSILVGTARTWNFVSYDGHTRDDNITGGDGDDILEAGETAELSIAVRNESPAGVEDLTGLWAELWATAPIVLELKMTGANDDDYEPENIFIGKQGAHPHPSVDGGGLTTPGWGDEFRIPCNWEAIRTEEPYESLSFPSESRMLLWRQLDGSYVLRTDYYSGDDSTFAGTLTTEGEFSNVSISGESADSLFFDAQADPNTIRFKFDGDATDDWLFFRAEAGAWLDISPDSVYIGTLSSGGSASADFNVEFGELIPDRNELTFTLAVRDTTNEYWFTDLSEQIVAPEVKWNAQRYEIRDGASVDTLALFPTLSNVGDATADSATAVLSCSGDMMVLPVRDTLEFSTIGGYEQEDSELPFLFVSGDSTRFYSDDVWFVRITTHFTNGEVRCDSLSDVDINPPDECKELVLDEGGGALVLRWEGPTSEVSDLAGYHVYQATPSDTTRITLEPVASGSRYLIDDLDTYDASGYIDYRYGVTSVDESGNESNLLLSGVGNLWIPSHQGWPNFVDTRCLCAPVAIDVTGDGELEVFAAGKAIYAWKADGDPLISSNSDGLFYDPVEDGDAADDFDDEECVFYGALAVEDIDDDGNYEVVGNLQPYGVYVIEYDHSPSPTVTKEWFRPAEDAWLCAPSIADLDSSGTCEVILSGGYESDLYVWESDGKTFQAAIDSSGVYGTVSGGARYNYGHVAVGEFDTASDGLEIIQTLGPKDDSGDCRARVTCWATDGVSGSQLWTTEIGDLTYLTLSTPVIGNIHAADDELEVVVARRAADDEIYQTGGLWLLDDEGAVVDSVETMDLYLRVEPAPVPVLAERGDGDDDLEVFIADGREGDNYGDWSTLLELFYWEADGSTGTSDSTTITDTLPIPGRQHRHSIGCYQPVIGDIDGDDSLEVVVCNNSNYLGCFSVEGTAVAEAGWPQRFPDTPLTPMIADVNADGDLDLLVADESGTIHLLQLPGESSGASLPWPQFGHDACNTSNYEGLSRGRGSTATNQDPLPTSRVFNVGPSVLQQQVGIRFGLPADEKVDLRIIDLQGRVVATLISEDLGAGEHSIHWDGRDATGEIVSNGVYFIRLARGAQVDVRRVAVIQ